MALSFEYCVLQVIPDRRRGEKVNVGIVVFGADNIDVRIWSSLHKVHALDANFDLDQIFRLPEILPKWVQHAETIAQKHKLLKDLGIVSVTDLGVFECDQVKYDWFVADILSSLVKPPAPFRRAKTVGHLHTALKDVFRNHELMGDEITDIEKHLVVANYPISTSENLFADFAFKNGVFHVTETINYRVKSGLSTDKFEETGLKAIKLVKAKETFGKNTKRYVVYSADAKTEKALTAHINLLSGYADQIYNLSSKNDKEGYFSHILQLAGVNGSLALENR